MRGIYKKTLIFITVLLLGCGFVGILYLFYDKVIANPTEVIADGDLSINFMNGSVAMNNDTYPFSITNSGDKDINYNIYITDIVGDISPITYSLISKDISLNIQNANIEKDDPILALNVNINSKETQNFEFITRNNNGASFKINIKKNEITEEYFYNTILNNNEIKEKPTTKVLEEIATTNEGLIKDIDDLGTTYYFRGNIPNNYVSIDNNLWRIVRINGDGSVKLVLNNTLEEVSNYHKDFDNFNEFTKTDIYKSLEDYYKSNLKEYESMLATNKYCIEEDLDKESEESLSPTYTRIITNKIPTFNCLGTSYSGQITTLTVDDVIYAGANLEHDNQDYYLYNKDIDNIWWTLSLAKTKNKAFYPFSVSKNGKIEYGTSGDLYRGLRPVINVVRKTIVTSGDGTLDNPYIITSGQ